MEKRIWFFDTNVLVNWVLGSGGLLKQLCDSFDISDNFFDIFYNRYKLSDAFVESIINSDKSTFPKDRFFVSLFALNELFSGIRSEINSILLFKDRVPLSRWKDSPPTIPEGYEKFVYDETMKTFDVLFDKERITIIEDQDLKRAWDQYLPIYCEILFLNKHIKTQDTTLLVTAILNKADFFITSDKWLIEDVSKSMLTKFNLSLKSPEEGSEILKNRMS
jgi:predicted nucleic acid-binding protein